MYKIYNDIKKIYWIKVDYVCVKEEYRNKKIATELFEKAFAIIKEEGNKSAILNTYKRFEAAVHLYKKLGFEIVETFDFLKNSPYSICMKKDF